MFGCCEWVHNRVTRTAVVLEHKLNIQDDEEVALTGLNTKQIYSQSNEPATTPAGPPTPSCFRKTYVVGTYGAWVGGALTLTGGLVYWFMEGGTTGVIVTVTGAATLLISGVPVAYFGRT